MSYWDGWTDAKIMTAAAAAGDAAVQRAHTSRREFFLQQQIDTLKAEMNALKSQRDVAWATYTAVQKSLEALPQDQRAAVETTMATTFAPAFDARAAELGISDHGLSSTIYRRLLGR